MGKRSTRRHDRVEIDSHLRNLQKFSTWAALAITTHAWNASRAAIWPGTFAEHSSSRRRPSRPRSSRHGLVGRFAGRWLRRAKLGSASSSRRDSRELLKKNRLKSVAKLNCGAGRPSTPSSLLGCCGLYGFGVAAYVIVVVARCRIGASLAPGLPLQRGAGAFLTVVFVVRICIFELDGGRAPHTIAAMFSL